MSHSPFQIIIDTLDLSVNAIKPVVEAMKVTANTARHQLLLPDSEQGLQEPLFAYTLFLTENTLSGHNRTIKQLLADYNNQWSFLFDAVRDGDKTLEPLVKKARAAQKAAHARLRAILDSGNGDGRTEYEALTAALTALSEQMGENARAAAARSRKGIPHHHTKVKAWQAAMWSGFSVSTIRRYKIHPKYGLPPPPLNDTIGPEAAFRTWGDQLRAKKAAASEASAKDHAIPLSCVGKKEKVRHGLA